jgi:F-type H+-transporting ATPase subunit delta
MEYIGAIYHKLVELQLAAKNITCAVLTSARSMSPQEIARCKEMFEQKLERKFEIKHVIDQSIIGGVTLKFGSNLYDISVAGASKNLIREIQ